MEYEIFGWFFEWVPTMSNAQHSTYPVLSVANDLQFNKILITISFVQKNSTKFPQSLSMDEVLRITMMLTIHLQNCLCMLFFWLMGNVLKTHLLFRIFFVCGFVWEHAMQKLMAWPILVNLNLMPNAKCLFSFAVCIPG